MASVIFVDCYGTSFSCLRRAVYSSSNTSPNPNVAYLRRFCGFCVICEGVLVWVSAAVWLARCCSAAASREASSVNIHRYERTYEPLGNTTKNLGRYFISLAVVKELIEVSITGVRGVAFKVIIGYSS